MNRRNFMRLSALGVASLAGSIAKADASLMGVQRSAGPRSPRGRSSLKKYSVVIIGDTHYDKAPDSVYHEGYSDPNPNREAAHRKEFVRNANMWEDRMRRLLNRASKLVEEDTQMALQMGDLVQGDCADAANHKRMLDDAFCHIKGAIGRIPLVTVAGNHDLRGCDDSVATAAYGEYMTQRMSDELGLPIQKTCFAFWIGRDAYIVVDFTHPDDAEIDRLFHETEGARYTFVVIHGPVLPYQDPGSANWIIHGQKGHDEARRHFRQLLAQRNAIVLCGHTHATEFARWEGDGGSITQMTMNSVWSNDKKGSYNVITNKPEDYGREVEENGKPAMRDLIREYKPGIRAFSIAYSCGSYKLRVTNKGVSLEYHAGDSADVTATFQLR